MSVFIKLQQAKIELQAMPLKKSGHNKFAGYQYFELGDFLPQINSIFYGLGLCSVTSFTSELATLSLIDTEDNSETKFTSPMVESQMKGALPIQNLGAVETYQRRYLYMMALDIVEHDAIDAQPKGTITPNDGAGNDLTQNQRNLIADTATAIKDAWSVGQKEPAIGFYSELKNEEKLYLWTLLDRKIRNQMKAYVKEKENGV